MSLVVTFRNSSKSLRCFCISICPLRASVPLLIFLRWEPYCWCCSFFSFDLLPAQIWLLALLCEPFVFISIRSFFIPDWGLSSWIWTYTHVLMTFHLTFMTCASMSRLCAYVNAYGIIFTLLLLLFVFCASQCCRCCCCYYFMSRLISVFEGWLVLFFWSCWL